MNQTYWYIFSTPLLSQSVRYFCHCPAFYFPRVFQIYLPLTGGSKKQRRGTAGIMKCLFSALWLSLLISLLLLQQLSKLSSQYIKELLISALKKTLQITETENSSKVLLNRIFTVLQYFLMPMYKFCKPQDLVTTLWHALEQKMQCHCNTGKWIYLDLPTSSFSNE